MPENILTLEQFREWGRQGGKVRSAKKTESSRANMKAARIAGARKIIAELEAKPKAEPEVDVPMPMFDELDQTQ